MIKIPNQYRFESRLLKMYYTKGMFWLRVFEIGLWFASYRVHPPLFSERNGFVHTLSLGKWRVKALPFWENQKKISQFSRASKLV